MAFTVTTNRKVDWPVSIDLPINGGKTEVHECSMTFEILSQANFVLN